MKNEVCTPYLAALLQALIALFVVVGATLRIMHAFRPATATRPMSGKAFLAFAWPAVQIRNRPPLSTHPPRQPLFKHRRPLISTTTLKQQTT